MGKKKIVKKRGSRTHGHGKYRKHGKAGKRGGRGKAGTGKRADQKKATIWKKDYFGIHGFHHKKRRIEKINVGALSLLIDNLFKEGKAEKKGDEYHIDLSLLGINKLLGGGVVDKKIFVKVDSWSKKAKEKIEEKGGKILKDGAD